MNAARRAWWRENHPLYFTWQNIRKYCGVAKGLRPCDARLYDGIAMDEEWKGDFFAFEEWALGQGWNKGMYVVRVDKTGDFTPSNCIVTTPQKSINMRRNTFRVDGIPLREIIGKPTSGSNDVAYNRVYSRYKKGRWDLTSALILGIVPPNAKAGIRWHSLEVNTNRQKVGKEHQI